MAIQIQQRARDFASRSRRCKNDRRGLSRGAPARRLSPISITIKSLPWDRSPRECATRSHASRLGSNPTCTAAVLLLLVRLTARVDLRRRATRFARSGRLGTNRPPPFAQSASANYGEMSRRSGEAARADHSLSLVRLGEGDLVLVAQRACLPLSERFHLARLERL